MKLAPGLAASLAAGLAATAMLVAACATSPQTAGPNGASRADASDGFARNPYLPDYNNPGAITSDSRAHSN